MKAYTSSDYEMMKSWYQARLMPAPLVYSLPLTGFIVEDVAAGFLIQTDTNMAILDFFITNPAQMAMVRGRALNRIIAALMSRAKECGYDLVKCDSQIETIQRKAKSLKFHSLGSFNVYCKEI